MTEIFIHLIMLFIPKRKIVSKFYQVLPIRENLLCENEKTSCVEMLVLYY